MHGFDFFKQVAVSLSILGGLASLLGGGFTQPQECRKDKDLVLKAWQTGG